VAPPPQLGPGTGAMAVSRFSGGLGKEEGSLQRMVDNFLLSLPLGTSAQDAAVEDRVAECLLQLYREKQSLEDKLREW